MTRDPGFQEEKIESLYLPLQWSKELLVNILDKRIDHLIKRSYTRGKVSHKDILPKQINNQPAMDYILDRTFMRPRDIILFFNKCIEQAKGKPDITARMVNLAEGDYSRERLRSLQDEWSADYPNMTSFTEILKGFRSQFSLSELTKEHCEEFCLQFLTRTVARNDELSEAAVSIYDEKINAQEFSKIVILIFYNIGLLELKLEKFEGFSSIISGQTNISPAELDDDTKIKIHPMFWRVLGIKPM